MNLYKMSTVSEITGFSPTLLRAWERRYQFLKPSRLPGGHRVYSDDDLDLLKRVKELLESGRSIGEIATMGRDGIGAVSPESTTQPPGLESEIQSLASLDLKIFRSERYAGEGLSVSLKELELRDLATVNRLYQLVKGIYELWLYLDEPSRTEKVFVSRLSDLTSKEFGDAIACLGGGSCSYSPMVISALADCKRGALVPLLRHFEDLKAGRGCVKTCVLLARDQAKIMRNAFHDIDHNLRPADESRKPHAIGPMVKKLEKVLPHYEAHLDWDGSVSSRCLETSAVDRVLYEIVRRIEAAEADSVALWVGPLNDVLTRWAFQTGEKAVRPFEPEDLPTLAVSSAVGVQPASALEQGYIGSRPGWVWFHWPVFQVPAGSHMCRCDI